MRTATELSIDALQVARDSAETLVKFKAYLPPGGLLLMLTSKFQDDICDALGNGRGDLPRRGRERRPLDELTSVELDTVAGAVSILLQERFTAVMGDPALPKLLGEFYDSLNEQKAERARLRAVTVAS
jgi:hypothetical protein